MSNMFLHAHAFDQDISSWDVLGVTNMQNMFTSAQTFNQNISSWETSNVTNMVNLFKNAGQFNQNISYWTIQSSTTLTNMLSNSGISDGAYGLTVPTPLYTEFNKIPDPEHELMFREDVLLDGLVDTYDENIIVTNSPMLMSPSRT